MYKFIVVLATLCVVKASVIINVFDEDPEISASKSIHLEDCKYQACDQLCRNLGFTGGACVNGRCKCDINRKEDPEIRQALSFDCNPQWCDQLCRNFGFTGGACVHDRCKCDINRKEGPEISETKAVLLGDCNYQACDQRCRNIGFTGGVCVNGHCKCDINTREVPEIRQGLSERGTSANPLDCNPQWCDQQCRKFGYPSGSCIEGDCECINSKEAPLVVNDGSNFKQEKRKEGKTFSLPRACESFNCNDMCRILNYIGGMCENGVCQCF